MPASDLLTWGSGAVIQTTECLPRSVPHNLGLYVSFVWRGTQSISLNLLFIHISFSLIYLSAWFSVFIPALVLNHGEESPEISSLKWCQTWQCVRPWGIIFFGLQELEPGKEIPNLTWDWALWYIMHVPWLMWKDDWNLLWEGALAWCFRFCLWLEGRSSSLSLRLQYILAFSF